jgi:hypothetical protein
MDAVAKRRDRMAMFSYEVGVGADYTRRMGGPRCIAQASPENRHSMFGITVILVIVHREVRRHRDAWDG